MATLPFLKDNPFSQFFSSFLRLLIPHNNLKAAASLFAHRFLLLFECLLTALCL